MKMKKTLKFALVTLFMMSLCACGNKEVETETELVGTDAAVSDVVTQYDNNVTMQYSKDEPEEIPFQVWVDKSALENGTKDSDIVAIITEMTDWKYTVETDYGKIINKGQTSFEYIRPEGQNEDNIIISVTNKENAKEYRTVIPLFFMEQTNEVTITFVPDEG